MLDITDLGGVLSAGIRNVAAACLALDYPTMASLPHSLVNGYKNVLAVSVETDYTFPLEHGCKQGRNARVCSTPALLLLRPHPAVPSTPVVPRAMPREGSPARPLCPSSSL